ncbi:hypothetical protein DdX_20987 [Ditylenchus destructor]|uniref:Uncharacterized protein n=1 Tax=Ditylenchus destructor TaxID=166010 RepID=A0AAD4QVX4_9BILA|nr:hypothetical protein DdX_20987 [Ditylenchus destructor]
MAKKPGVDGASSGTRDNTGPVYPCVKNIEEKTANFNSLGMILATCREKMLNAKNVVRRPNCTDDDVAAADKLALKLGILCNEIYDACRKFCSERGIDFEISKIQNESDWGDSNVSCDGQSDKRRLKTPVSAPEVYVKAAVNKNLSIGDKPPKYLGIENDPLMIKSRNAKSSSAGAFLGRAICYSDMVDDESKNCEQAVFFSKEDEPLKSPVQDTSSMGAMIEMVLAESNLDQHKGVQFGQYQ